MRTISVRIEFDSLKDGYFRNFRSMENWISSKKTRI